MRKTILSTFMAGTLLLGGCATGMGGDPLAGILGSVLGGGLGTRGYDDGGDRFQRAAVDACGRQASQYGRVSITNVQQRSRDVVRVDGAIQTNDGYGQRGFTCSFRSDGRITDFRIA